MMGLDISHDAFSGAYSAFNRFRQKIATVIGGSYPPHSDKSLDPEMFYWPDGFAVAEHPGLVTLFKHSDCEGDIDPETCGKLADELSKLLPAIELDGGGGHIERDGGYGLVTKKFIAGCRAANTANEPLEFG